MIKNKALNIKIIFRTYSKILKNMFKICQVLKHIFILQNIREQFSKTILKNCFLELFFKNSYQANP